MYVDDFKAGDMSASFPSSSIINFEFPEREGMPAVKLTWMDGGLQPQRPEELNDDEMMGDWSGGVIFIGDKGKIMCGCYASNPKLLPSSKMEDFKEPAQTIERIEEGHGNECFFLRKTAVINYNYINPIFSYCFYNFFSLIF